MALKPDQSINAWQVEYYATGVYASDTKGLFVVHSINNQQSPSGAAMEQSENVISVPGNPSGHVVLGCLLSSVVSKDLAAGGFLDWNKDEVNIGQKASIATRGWVTTDKIQPGTTPSGGQTAYLGGTGLVTNSPLYVATGTLDGAAMLRNPVIGKFLSGKDADGFAKVAFNLP